MKCHTRSMDEMADIRLSDETVQALAVGLLSECREWVLSQRDASHSSSETQQDGGGECNENRVRLNPEQNTHHQQSNNLKEKRLGSNAV